MESYSTAHVGDPLRFRAPHDVTPRASALSTIMQDYWISFVNTLDPNDNRGNKRKAASLPTQSIQYLNIYLDQVPIGRSTRRRTR